ncbi:hypothetical protein [Streptomyces sp. NPDC057363]|uniref:hypothetical protein n=1 Tax=Streptomyces sp. NPDC057363 TaxID=3346107 RepID=UPI00362BA359
MVLKAVKASATGSTKSGRPGGADAVGRVQGEVGQGVQGSPGHRGHVAADPDVVQCVRAALGQDGEPARTAGEAPLPQYEFLLEGYDAAPSQVHADAAGRAAGRDVLQDPVVVPVPAAQGLHVEQIRELRSVPSGQLREVTADDPRLGQTRHHRHDEIAQAGGDDAQRKIGECPAWQVQGRGDLHPVLRRHSRSELRGSLVEFRVEPDGGAPRGHLDGPAVHQMERPASRFGVAVALVQDGGCAQGRVSDELEFIEEVEDPGGDVVGPFRGTQENRLEVAKLSVCAADRPGLSGKTAREFPVYALPANTST